MVHKILTIWDATCTTVATLFWLLLLAAATVLSTSVLVKDLAVEDKAAMSMAALLVSSLLPSTPVVAFEASQTTSAVPLEEVAPLPVLSLMVWLAVLPPVALEGAALSTVLFPLIMSLSMVGLTVTPAVALEGVATLSPASVSGEHFLFEALGCWASPPTERLCFELPLPAMVVVLCVVGYDVEWWRLRRRVRIVAVEICQNGWFQNFLLWKLGLWQNLHWN